MQRRERTIDSRDVGRAWRDLRVGCGDDYIGYFFLRRRFAVRGRWGNAAPRRHPSSRDAAPSAGGVECLACGLVAYYEAPMPDPMSRRDAIRQLGVAGAGAVLGGAILRGQDAD